MDPAELTAIIAAGGRFEGHVALQGAARVDGELVGQVRGPGALWVGADATVRADLELEEVVVEGRVQGSIRARRRIDLRAGAHVEGPLDAPRLAVADGARVDGATRIGEASGQEPDPGLPREARAPGTDCKGLSGTGH